MDPDSLTCSCSAVVVSLLCSRNAIGPVGHHTHHAHHAHHTQRYGTPRYEHKALGRRTGSFCHHPSFSGLRKMALASMRKEICNTWQNRKLQIVPNLYLGPTGSESR
ncbi:hypothetical protein F5Y11DRAFT_331992 [Daldinia sp. FL1419]|nr:hypothetical protein F5Y11DRAFT_331992 [Daldinia sp. FL1419]